MPDDVSLILGALQSFSASMQQMYQFQAHLAMQRKQLETREQYYKELADARERTMKLREEALELQKKKEDRMAFAKSYLDPRRAEEWRKDAWSRAQMDAIMELRRDSQYSDIEYYENLKELTDRITQLENKKIALENAGMGQNEVLALFAASGDTKTQQQIMQRYGLSENEFKNIPKLGILKNFAEKAETRARELYYPKLHDFEEARRDLMFGMPETAFDIPSSSQTKTETPQATEETPKIFKETKTDVTLPENFPQRLTAIDEDFAKQLGKLDEKAIRHFLRLIKKESGGDQILRAKLYSQTLESLGRDHSVNIVSIGKYITDNWQSLASELGNDATAGQ